MPPYAIIRDFRGIFNMERSSLTLPAVGPVMVRFLRGATRGEQIPGRAAALTKEYFFLDRKTLFWYTNSRENVILRMGMTWVNRHISWK
jgi:predicted metalloprotease with PDZ domain